MPAQEVGKPAAIADDGPRKAQDPAYVDDLINSFGVSGGVGPISLLAGGYLLALAGAAEQCGQVFAENFQLNGRAVKL